MAIRPVPEHVATMFHSFFPRPKLFFFSFLLWASACIGAWYGFAADLGQHLGLHFPGAVAATDNAEVQSTINLWLYQYMLVAYLAFMIPWSFFGKQPWAKWSVFGSGLIVFITWFQVEVSVMLNEWYGGFYDLIQNALSKPGTVQIGDYFSELATVAWIIMIAVAVAVFNRFFVSHFVFRWRTAMTDYYTKHWQRLRHIEGASQRIQEDTMRFATIVENLGVSLLESIMTLIAFLPILWLLSEQVKELPLIGEVPHALVFVAIIWSIFGTFLLGLAGIKLPGLEFKNQRVEAAYRKELVLGEDQEHRAHPLTLGELFANVRQNYFRLYFHYLYFNVVRFGYINIGQFVPLIALAPSIVAGAFTLGVMQRILNAFNQVENSFQYLVNSWTTIVELLSIHKRLKAFEATLEGQPLSDIELTGQAVPVPVNDA